MPTAVFDVVGEQVGQTQSGRQLVKVSGGGGGPFHNDTVSLAENLFFSIFI